MKYKGIILAGGKGTRLYPSSNVVSKQLINVYDKPLIYYPLSTLMLSNIRDILIISTPDSIDQFKNLLGNGNQWGINLEYAIQENANGLAEAFIIGEDFIGNDNVCLVLGDNILYGNSLKSILNSCKDGDGSTIFSYPVTDPHRFGIVEYDGTKVISIEEKPEKPKSNRAVIGIYFFDNKVVEYAKSVKPSLRGELEMASIHNRYLDEGNLKVEVLNRGITWIDAGTFDSLLMASNFISTLEKIQSYKISCPEEISYSNGWITKDELRKLAEPLLKSGYGEYLNRICEEK
jgi:glucose-1-phosphate thymidylyltransferase